MRRKYTLQSTTERSMIVRSTSCVRVIAESFVPVTSNCIRGQSIQDLVLVPSTSFNPGVQLVHHHSLNLGWTSVLVTEKTGMGSKSELTVWVDEIWVEKTL